MVHVVVLSHSPKLSVHEVGPAIARTLRRPIADVTRKLRDCRGIIDLDLNRIDAEIVQSILARQNVAAEVVPAGDLPALGKPLPLVDADPLAEGLDIQKTLSPEATGLLPWDRVHIAVVGAVTFSTVLSPVPFSGRTLESTDLDSDYRQPAGLFLLPSMAAGWGIGVSPQSHTIPEKRRPPKAETILVLDLLTDDDALRYRVLASRFVYDYLGPRMKLCSGENFRTLVEDIARLSPDTLLAGTTLQYLENPKSRDIRFGSQEEFEGYVRWLAAWSAVFGATE